MRQGAAVAHALVGRPRLLILDEPFSGLDPTWRQALLQQLAEMRNGGTTLLFSSHIVEDVERLADRVGLVCSGRIREITTTAALAQGLAQRYLIRSRGRTPLPAAWPIGRDQWLWEVPADGLWTALADLRAAGHQLMEVRPAGSVGERGCPSGPEPP
jgi:ABC-type multidrug transport system ATPase subunit